MNFILSSVKVLVMSIIFAKETMVPSLSTSALDSSQKFTVDFMNNPKKLIKALVIENWFEIWLDVRIHPEETIDALNLGNFLTLWGKSKNSSKFWNRFFTGCPRFSFWYIFSFIIYKYKSWNLESNQKVCGISLRRLPIILRDHSLMGQVSRISFRFFWGIM